MKYFSLFSPKHLILACALSSVGFSAELYVAPSGTGDCSSTNPCNLHTALNRAAGNGESDTIYVKPGTYIANNTFSAQITDGEDLTIVGESTPSNKPILSGDTDGDGTPDTQIMYIRGSTNLKISKLIFEKGTTNNRGGGLYVELNNGDVTILLSEFTDNHADDRGGGAYIKTLNGNISISESKFENNTAGVDGNSLYAEVPYGYMGNAEVFNNVFKGNGVNSTKITGNNIEIRSNTFAGDGMNFILNSGEGNVVNNIVDNELIRAHVREGNLNITNNTVNEGSIYVDSENDSSIINIYNNIVWNTPTPALPTIMIWADVDGNNILSSVNVFNNLVACSTPSDCIWVNPNTSTLSEGANISGDPLFVNPGAGDLHIQPTSPAVDMGNNVAPGLPSNDIDGDARVIGAAVDIGADEVTDFSTSGHLYVAPDGAGSLCTETNPCQIHTAMNIASTDGIDSIIHVKDGVYELTSTLTFNSDGKSLTIQPWYPDKPKPVLRPDDIFNSFRIMSISAGNANVTIKGIAFKFGSTDRGAGGALYVSGQGTITVENCLFERNSAKHDGGAISLQSDTGDLIVNNCEFYNNTSYNPQAGCCGGGGAIDIRSNKGKVMVKNSIFRRNSALVNGGAVEAYTMEGEIRIESNLFESNTAVIGGALNVGLIKGTATIINNMFNNNASGLGGATHITNAPPFVGCMEGGHNCEPSQVKVHLINNTFHSNISQRGGGGAVYINLVNDTSEAHIYNNILWENIDLGPVRGDDMFINTWFLTINKDETKKYKPIIALFNNIFSLNALFDPTSDADSDPNRLKSQDLFVRNTTNYSHGNNITQDPLFVNGGEGDLHIQRRSPAIDAGDNSAPFLSTVSKDIDGDNRIENGTVDIGADEFVPSRAGGGGSGGGSGARRSGRSGDCSMIGVSTYAYSIIPVIIIPVIRRFFLR